MTGLDRRRFGMLLACMPVPALARRQPPRPLNATLPTFSRFVVYYGMQDDPALREHDIGVLDSDIDPAIVKAFKQGGLPLGYLSLGEVHADRSYAADMDRRGELLFPNPKWPDARFVDFRDARWKRRVLRELIPAILDRGFGGVFFDTLDDAAYLERTDPVQFAGTMNAAVDLVKAVRASFAGVPLMVNRGYDILPRVLFDIDMLMGESVHSTYDAASGGYVRVADADRQWQLDRMAEARRVRPKLPVFSLDYWSPKDRAGIANIYSEASAAGFIPYVSTIDLSQVVPKP